MAEDKNMELYEQLCTPPNNAVRRIDAGKLKGKSDINTQWRYEVLTQVLGPCGVGWKYEIVDTKFVDVPATSEKLVYVMVKFQWLDKESGKWSEPIFGWGGDFVIVKDKWGLHGNDEAMKMATTDAIGTAAKHLGVGADVYRGLLDDKGVNDSKYQEHAYAAQNAQNAAGRTQNVSGSNYTHTANNSAQNDARRKAFVELGEEMERAAIDKKVVAEICAKKFKKPKTELQLDEIKALTNNLVDWAMELSKAGRRH